MQPDKAVTLFMIGDSTMAQKDTTKGPERGWGMMVQELFNPDLLVVDNHAVNGRSSKSFIDEGRWQTVLDKVKPGDYVIIQFGHNDQKAEVSRHTDPGTTFDANIRRFIIETKSKGGHPVVMNPVARRNFTGKLPKDHDDEALRNTTASPNTTAFGASAPKSLEGDTLIDTHGYYRYSPREVALEQGVTFIDANKITHQLEQKLGPMESRKLHLWYDAGEIPELPKGRRDNTHYNIYGARVVAKLLIDELCHEVPDLKQRRR
ncbi:MAG: rhamnogalacturonan acetylesterase [Bacteroidaceae bacterium]|nr:rhamnogalacturonan acetylesterase [Bacteroidaceae bacterium]